MPTEPRALCWGTHFIWHCCWHLPNLYDPAGRYTTAGTAPSFLETPNPSHMALHGTSYIYGVPQEEFFILAFLINIWKSVQFCNYAKEFIGHSLMSISQLNLLHTLMWYAFHMCHIWTLLSPSLFARNLTQFDTNVHKTNNAVWMELSTTTKYPRLAQY